MQKAKTIQELRDQVLEHIALAASDPRRVHQCEAVTNGAGKVVNMVKLEVMYALTKGEEPDIPFLGKTSGKLLKPGAKLLSQ